MSVFANTSTCTWMKRKRSQPAVLTCCGAVTLLLARECLAGGGPALEREVNFQIPSQLLESVLMESSTQAGVPVSINARALGHAAAPSLDWRLTAGSAFSRLIAHSDLTRPAVGDTGTVLPEKSVSSGAVIRTVDAGPAADAEEDKNSRSASVTPASASRTSTDDRGRVVEEIVVTGSRLEYRADETPAPVITFNREQIDQLGVTNVADVLNYLPQQSFSYSDGTSGFAAARRVQLRGLGAGNTLVLINGRRTVTSALVGAFNFFDLNTIPLSAVDRVEVVSNSASAVYGADAVGGVVNIITKKAIRRPTVDLYAGAADEGAGERRGSVTMGVERERVRASAVFDYFSRDFLLGEHRDLYANQDYRRFGSKDARVRFSNPGTVCSKAPQNLPGLPSRCAAIPAGSTGTNLSPSDFLQTAGQTNLVSANRFMSVVPRSERYSGLGFFDLQLTESTELFAEALYSHRHEIQQLAPTGLSVSVPTTNPFNPFGVQVTADYLFTGVGAREDQTTASSYRGVVGLRGKWASQDWEVSYLDSREYGRSELLRAVSAAGVSASLAETDPAGALNVFEDGPGGSPALLASLIAPPPDRTYSSVGRQIGTDLSGKLFSVPAGSVEFVLGGEARTEEIVFRSGLVAADRRSTAEYLELRVPLAEPGMEVPLLNRLAFTFAGRYDDYDDVGSTFNPQLGLMWNPEQRLLIRASYGTSFRPPSLFQLHLPQLTVADFFDDPRRNNTTATFTRITGGNPDLEPERAHSLAAGLVFNTKATGGIRLAATYWRITQDKRVAGLPVGLILANESQFQNRVIRAAPTDEDLAAGLPGRLISVDASSVNFGRLETSGVDFEVSSSVDTTLGEFRPTILVTRVSDYTVVDLPDTPAMQRVGLAGILGSVPQWRAAARIAWQHSGLSLSAALRYRSSYDDANSLNVPNGRVIPSQSLVDVQAAFNPSEALASSQQWLRGLVISAGVQNLFDREPSFSELSSAGFDASQADTRQRFGYLSVSKSF